MVMKKSDKRPLLLAVAIASAMAFFGIAFSALDNWLKALLMLATLAACGSLVRRLTGWEDYYGFMIARGGAGLGWMKVIAKNHAAACRRIVDAGLTLCFGLPYGARVFGWRSKQWMEGATLNILFFAFFFIMQAGTLNATSVLFICLGLLGGLCGVGFGFIIQHAFNVLTVPNTPPGVTLLLPGITLPWESVFAVLAIAVVHELAHGVLANVEKVKIKSSGVLLLGFLPVGAFVEPDEKALQKRGIHTKRRVLAAGSISNALFFFVFLALALATAAALNSTIERVSVSAIASNSTAPIGLQTGDALTSFASAREAEAFFFKIASEGGGWAVTQVNGAEKGIRISEVSVDTANAGSPNAGLLAKGEVLLSADGAPVYGFDDLESAVRAHAANATIAVETTAGAKLLKIGTDGKLGVSFRQTLTFEATDAPSNAALYALLAFLLVVFSYAYLLNFILAIMNLLPLFLTDGHRIIYEEFVEAWGKKKAALYSALVGFATIGLLLLNALPWLWA